MKDDTSLLAQFFYADEALNLVAAELDSFDGRKDPERCSALVNHLRQCQDKVLSICNRIMDESIPGERANRDFRVKFPDDVMQENLAGQLWFGAECLAAGSSIMNRESESAAMRPLAKALTKALENVRNLLREQCLRGCTTVAPSDLFAERVQEALKIFDRLFAEFELSYVSAMVPVKTPREYELQQLVVVLFSETLQRALKMKLLTQDMVDDYDPALMFTIPRLAIVSGLLIFPDGPLCLDRPPSDMSEMFRPFRTLLHKIRELLWTLNKKELYTLEKLLCSSEELDYSCTNGKELIESNSVSKEMENNLPASYPTVPDLDDFVTRFYIDYPSCKQFVTDFYAMTADKEKLQECNHLEKEPSVSWENTEDSEDETEWVGETSECETLVTEILNTEEGTVPSTEHDGSLSDNDGTSVPNLRNSATFNMNIQINSSIHPTVESGSHSSDSTCNEPSILGTALGHADNGSQMHIVSTLPFPSSTLIASDFSMSDEDRFPMNTEVYSEDNGQCSHSSDTFNNHLDSNQDFSRGFLMANQVEHDMMLTTSGSQSAITSRIPRQPPPDEGTQEAICVATATLSTLLLSHGSDSSVSSPVHQRPEVEEDANTQSPIDSGVGTVISCSDTGSFSDRSPEAPQIESCENRGGLFKTSPEHHCICKDSSPATIVEHDEQNSPVDNTLVHPPQDSRQSQGYESESHDFSFSSTGLQNQSEILSNSVCDKNSISHNRNNCGISVCSVSQHCSHQISHSVNSRKRDSNVCEQSVPQDLCEVNVVNDFSDCVNSVFNNELCDRKIRTEEYLERNVPTNDMVQGVDESMRVNTGHVLPTVCVSSDEKEKLEGASSSNANETVLSLRYLPRRSSPHGKSVSPQFRKKFGIETSDRKQVPCPATAGAVPGNTSRGLEPPVVGSYSSSCSSCRSSATASSDSCSMSSDTSSFNSECQDDEEIALAMQAAEIANRNEARAKFRSSEDLVHRLFVCIAGVADQLQTNFAGDLRNILKCVFLMSAVSNGSSSSLENDSEEQVLDQDTSSTNDLDSSRVENAEEAWEAPLSPSDLESPPPWVPDGEAPRCMSCEAVFTVVRRRHHCRNCGKVFCARCSSNSVPLPRYGHVKPVRVCNRCFLYQVTPFTVEDMTTTRS
ncbi:Lateral signaling target protein 2 homolog [Gryllus bimaculatus]|nr:Lateral signaling target protein 2 homolog [Gryllus bimaculatus]